MDDKKIVTKTLTARIAEEDHNFITEFVKPFETKHEGFTALVNAVKHASNPLVLEQKTNDANFEALDYSKLSFEQQDTFLKNIFAESFYKEFANPEDPKQALSGIIAAVNKAKEPATPPAQLPNDLTAFVPEPLKERVEKLRLHLIEKGQGPAESNPEEYLAQLLTHALTVFLDNNFKNI